jgi:hypothetical protein
MAILATGNLMSWVLSFFVFWFVFFPHPGKAEFYQDRDPLRVSVSREQSFLESPLAHDPFGCHQPPAQENSKSHDDNAEAGKRYGGSGSVTKGDYC